MRIFLVVAAVVIGILAYGQQEPGRSIVAGPCTIAKVPGGRLDQMIERK